MFEITIWCDDIARMHTIEDIISKEEDFRIVERKITDIMIVDLSNSSHKRKDIIESLKKLNEKTILILLADHSDQLLEIMGLYVYQYILHEQLVERLPSCLRSIHSYLMNVTSICIHHAQGKQYIKYKDIYACIYEDGFVYLLLKDHRMLTQFTSLEKIAKLLTNEFISINRQTIIHVSYLDMVQNDRVIMINQTVFPLSRRRKKQLLAMLDERRHVL